MRIRFGRIKREKSRSSLASIGEGRFRIARVVDGTVEKTHKQNYTRDYGFFQVEYPIKPYIRWKYGVRDLNELEARNYWRFFANAPESLRACFPKVFEVTGENTKSKLRMEVVRDFDGKKSNSLSDCKKIDDSHFWRKFDKIIRFLSAKNILLMDLRAENIMVKRTSEKTSVPAIVDYKCASGRMYPFQPATWFTKGAMKKMLRRAERIRKQYKNALK